MFESNILNYISIGLLFLVGIELLHSRTEENKLKWYERIIIALFWPITMLIFLVAFLYGVYTEWVKKNKDE